MGLCENTIVLNDLVVLVCKSLQIIAHLNRCQFSVYRKIKRWWVWMVM